MSAKVRLAFAWPNATAPMQIYNKTAARLSHKDDLLIFERNITTGKTKASDLPLQVCLFWQSEQSDNALNCACLVHLFHVLIYGQLHVLPSCAEQSCSMLLQIALQF